MSTILEPPTEIKEPTTQHSDTTDDVLVQSAPEMYRLTVTEYHKMIDAGVFNEDARVELLNGRIIKMSPKSVLHAAVNEDASDIFKRLLKKRAVVRSQNPIVLNNSSEPEPDVVVVKPPKAKYYKGHPTAQDILLVLEIADSSLQTDRRHKALSYAQSGIAQYIILNLKTSELLDFREPSPEGYRSLKTLRSDERFNLVAFPEIEIKVSDLLPPE